MLAYVARCAGQLAVALVGIVTVAFFLMRAIPGDPAIYMLGDFATTEALATLRARLGLDLPVWQQYGMFLASAARGDLGASVVTGQSALAEIWSAVPPSAELAVAGMTIAIAFGVPLGIIAAVRQGTFIDVAVMALALGGISFPVFWLGLVAILFFSHELGLFPALGASSEAGLLVSLHHLALPAMVLGLSVAAYIARLTRSAMLEVLNEDYVRTARAGGLSRFRVISVHALRNALIPVVTVIGLQLGHLLSGAILTETIFSWPGIGKWLVEAIQRRDYPQLQGGIIIVAALMMAVNLIVDIVYGLLNPQIRHGRR